MGTYRLLLKQNENKKFKFYSESEFNISNLKEIKKNLVSEAEDHVFIKIIVMAELLNYCGEV